MKKQPQRRNQPPRKPGSGTKQSPQKPVSGQTYPMSWMSWLRASKFRIYSLAFIMMLVSALLLYPSARSAAADWIWPFMAIFIFANLILLVIQ